jgi:hypothetical protein
MGVKLRSSEKMTVNGLADSGTIWTTPEQHRKHCDDDPTQQARRATGSDDFQQVEQALSSRKWLARCPYRAAGSPIPLV